MFKFIATTLLLTMMMAPPALAQEFNVTSTTIAEGEKLTDTHVFQGFGCEGDNQSPQLSWTGAPEGTQSFAINVYDPDAPTGSGWWHWNVINIPASVSSVAQDASAEGTLPQSAMETRNDYGVTGFGGACPPPGEVHRYVFTVYALGERLDVPADASNALVGFMIRANALDSDHITAIYHR